MYRKVLKTIFQQDLGIYIVKQCNARVRQVRENIHEREDETNIRYYRDSAIINKRQSYSESVKEVIRIVDTVQEERQYVKEKFPNTYKLINMEVQVNIPGLIKTLAAMKYYYGINHYGL